MLYLFKQLKLLPPEALITTSAVDHADWNYRPFLSLIQRTRFKIVASLLSDRKYPKLLEAGYGSGVFMPYLNDLSEELYGIDPHDKNQEVAESLTKCGIKATLYSGSVTQLPFSDKELDAIVIVSAIEYVDDIETACLEMKRVLKPDGELVLVTPGHSPIVDMGLKLLTGESAKDNYDERRARLEPTLLKHFQVRKIIKAPPLIHPLVCLYTGYKLIQK